MNVVVLVVDANRTQRDMVKRGVEVLQLSNPRVLGTVFNKVDSKGGGYDGYYHYQNYNENGGSNVEKHYSGARRLLFAKVLRGFLRKNKSGASDGKLG